MDMVGLIGRLRLRNVLRLLIRCWLGVGMFRIGQVYGLMGLIRYRIRVVFLKLFLMLIWGRSRLVTCDDGYEDRNEEVTGCVVILVGVWHGSSEFISKVPDRST